MKERGRERKRERERERERGVEVTDISNSLIALGNMM